MITRREMLQLKLTGLTYRAIGIKAGVSRQYIQQVLSPPKAVRLHIIAKYKGLCAQCGIDIGASGHVHHKGGNGDTWDDLDNLELLCRECHVAETARQQGWKKKLGQLAQSRLPLEGEKT